MRLPHAWPGPYPNHGYRTNAPGRSLRGYRAIAFERSLRGYRTNASGGGAASWRCRPAKLPAVLPSVVKFVVELVARVLAWRPLPDAFECVHAGA